MSHREKKYFLKSLKKRRASFLTDQEVKILRTQIRRDSRVIDGLIRAIDLLVNKEGCPQDCNLLFNLRRRLFIAIEENDTFRHVLWRHLQLTECSVFEDGALEAVSFLAGQIRSRERAFLAQLAMK